VFEHIGVIAGMEGVTIIHGCSCEGRKVYLLPGGKSGVRSRVDKSLPSLQPSPEGEGTDGGDLASYIDLNDRRDLRLGQA
jgi:hypothetical protein